LRAKFPQLYDDAGGAPDLARELAFLRARLGALALRPDAPEDAILRTIAELRKMAATVAAMSAQAALAGAAASLPAGEMPRMRLELTVVDPPPLQRDPMDGDVEGEPLDS
jgi:hypothetical protein